MPACTCMHKWANFALRDTKSTWAFVLMRVCVCVCTHLYMSRWHLLCICCNCESFLCNVFSLLTNACFTFFRDCHWQNTSFTQLRFYFENYLYNKICANCKLNFLFKMNSKSFMANSKMWQISFEFTFIIFHPNWNCVYCLHFWNSFWHILF